jgi:DNA methyltransferase 1-associated protein 1
MKLRGEYLEYSFAKYNVQSTAYTYSQDEYTRFLEGMSPGNDMLLITNSYIYQDKEWTKEETDYLFNLIQEYDLRWFAVHDRYDFLGGVKRTIDVCVDDLISRLAI